VEEEVGRQSRGVFNAEKQRRREAEVFGALRARWEAAVGRESCGFLTQRRGGAEDAEVFICLRRFREGGEEEDWRLFENTPKLLLLSQKRKQPSTVLKLKTTRTTGKNNLVLALGNRLAPSAWPTPQKMLLRKLFLQVV
jgi:hypothetical protein